ncbi:MAG: hypothetical protein KJO13_09850 [Gammaproteobacteria bacterium]|nr:hypothetical protein [Gammaproteobacteria bacterium]
MIRATLIFLTLMAMAAPAAAERTFVVDELVVTARKKQEDQLQVPVSLSAYTEQTILDL